jgi:hypothetical protein
MRLKEEKYCIIFYSSPHERYNTQGFLRLKKASLLRLFLNFGLRVGLVFVDVGLERLVLLPFLFLLKVSLLLRQLKCSDLYYKKVSAGIYG